MRGYEMSLGSMVLVIGLLAGCASGPSPEELARQAQEQEQRQARERQAKAEQEAKRQAELQKVRAELDALLANVAAAEQRGMAAERRGELRKAFQEYVTAVQMLATRRDLWAANLDRAMQASQTVRERLFGVTSRLDPPPAVPEEAERYFLRGMAGMKSAASVDDYRQVTQEFLHALDLAPWWGDVYFNMAVVMEKTGEAPEQSIRLYRLYLLANPSAADAGVVKAKIAELEYNQERTARLMNGWLGEYVFMSAVEHTIVCGTGAAGPARVLMSGVKFEIVSVDVNTRRATARLFQKDWAGSATETGMVFQPIASEARAPSTDNVVELNRGRNGSPMTAKVAYHKVETFNDIPCNSWLKFEGPIEKINAASLDGVMRGLFEGTMPEKSKR